MAHLSVGQRVQLDVVTNESTTPAAAAHAHAHATRSNHSTNPTNSKNDSTVTATSSTATDSTSAINIRNGNASKATIRWIGHLPERTQLFIGIEWDTPGIGKNNGDYNGVQYFQCESTVSNSASFVHPARLTPEKTLLQAVHDKYEQEEAKGSDELYLQAMNLLPTTSTDKDEHQVRHRAIQVPVEFVGVEKTLKKVRDTLVRLRIISLVGSQVGSIDSPDDVQSKLPNIIDIDLSNNLLVSWKVLPELNACFPKLLILRLSQNLLNHGSLALIINLSTSASTSHTSIVFQQLQTLVLNDVPRALDSVFRLSSEGSFPMLQELCLSHNDIVSLRLDVAAESTNGSLSDLSDTYSNRFPNLTSLDLSNNKISDWNEILVLSRLPKLSSLILSHNFLQSINFPIELSASNSSCFPQLSMLALNDNNILELSSIENLKFCQNLVDLRVLRNKMLEMDIANHYNQVDAENPFFPSASSIPLNVRLSTLCRFAVISLLPSLKTLNSSIINPRERSDAEKHYLSNVLRIVQHSPSMFNFTMFPIYSILAPKYGFSLVLENEATTQTKTIQQDTSDSLASSLSLLRLQLVDAEGNVVRQEDKRLKLTLLVSDLRVLLDRTFKITPPMKRLYEMRCNQNNANHDWLSLSDIMKSLSFYGVQDGTIIQLRKKKS